MVDNIFRNACVKDIPEIKKIYEYYNKSNTRYLNNQFYTTVEFKKIFKSCKELNLPFVVLEKGKKIMGFAYLSKFRDKNIYKHTYENSIYVNKRIESKGFGSKLLSFLINESLKNKKIKNIIAVIADKDNISSIKIHKKNGFTHIGILKKIAVRKEKWLDIIIMQKKINEKN
tara:strand:- start:2 stop:517 length:516 start_codon:yes stop_codon:yes gene_type:complete